ncbi:hypothetical protein [Candidatus Regiella insecticola]|uniref:hypothetical protein n=1 Tax=Candidatus Regiella insecticola TaxID=138073 RepID=UPI0015967531|nr:hypothetical protein [Candidatus Regiella insecticola]
MSVMLFCTLLPIFLLLGHYLIAEARHCIGDIEGTLPTRLPFAVVLMTLFAGVASVVSTRGILLGQSWLLVLRDLLLLGWSVLLTQLDVARGWLPLRNTGGLIFSGLLFSLLPQAPVPFLQAMREGGVMFLGLSLFRGWVNRHGVVGAGFCGIARHRRKAGGSAVGARHSLCPLSLRLSCRGYFDATSSFSKSVNT